MKITNLTQKQLFALLTSDKTPTVTLPDGRAGYLNGVQREDGSGRSFNVTVTVATQGSKGPDGRFVPGKYERVTVHVRTAG